jgi:hypothetical protein
MSCDSGNGSGLNRTAFTTLKIAVLAPIPKVRTASAEIVNPGLLRSTRAAYMRDCRKAVMTEI